MRVLCFVKYHTMMPMIRRRKALAGSYSIISVMASPIFLDPFGTSTGSINSFTILPVSRKFQTKWLLLFSRRFTTGFETALQRSRKFQWFTTGIDNLLLGLFRNRCCRNFEQHGLIGRKCNISFTLCSKDQPFNSMSRFKCKKIRFTVPVFA